MDLPVKAFYCPTRHFATQQSAKPGASSNSCYFMRFFLPRLRMIIKILGLVISRHPCLLSRETGSMSHSRMHPARRMRPNRRKARIYVEQLEARNLMSFTPAQIVHAYGFDQISPPGGRGFGQTIAIIDAYYDPTIKSDLANFSTKYGLPQLDGNFPNHHGTFTQVDLTGGGNGKIQSPPGDDWTVETALDVEWAHAVAPNANILLVEANSDQTDPVTSEPTDLLNAVDY